MHSEQREFWKRCMLFWVVSTKFVFPDLKMELDCFKHFFNSPFTIKQQSAMLKILKNI